MKDDTQPKTPFAILYLPDAKAGATIPVYGRSSKRYSFIPCDLVNKKPARVYDDPEVFAREELDLRRNPRPTAVICVSIGPVNPVIRAKAAVDALIGSRQSVGAGTVRDALTAIVLQASNALAALNETVASSEAQPATEPQQSPVATPTEAPVISSPESTKVEKLPVLNEPSLQVLPIEELKALATKRGVTRRSRAEMVSGILQKQAEEAVLA